MSLRHLLVDLDNTLYPASSGLLEEIDRRITVFVCDLLGLSVEQTLRLRAGYRKRYGTTLTGLLEERHLADPDIYLEAVHPAEVGRFIRRDEGLVRVLASLSVPRSVFTNSPAEHAARVLRHLEVEPYFDRIFDLRYSGFHGKPAEQAYRRVLAAIGEAACDVLLVDDHEANLEAFRRLGGRTLLVRENGAAQVEGAAQAEGGAGTEPIAGAVDDTEGPGRSVPEGSGSRFPFIRSLHQLPDFLAGYSREPGAEHEAAM